MMDRTKESSSTICSRGKVSTIGNGKIKRIQASGSKTTCTDKVFTNGPMEESTLVNLWMISRKDKVRSNGQMVGNTSAPGRIISNTAKAFMKKMGNKRLEFGLKAKGNNG